MTYLHMYKGTVTAGGTDGDLISEGTGLTPISVTLNATSAEESSDIKLALRCEEGYATTGNTVITPTGNTYLKWKLAPNNGGVAGTYGAAGAALTISTSIGSTNQLFFAKAISSSDETPVNDTTVDFVVTATIGAI